MSMSVEEFRILVSGKPNKFGAKRVEVDGSMFDSMGEARYWQVLRLRERAGEIYGLERQKRYEIRLNDEHICWIIPDFVFYEKAEKRLKVLDFKGVVSPMFRLKAKLFKAQYGFPIEVVK